MPHGQGWFARLRRAAVLLVVMFGGLAAAIGSQNGLVPGRDTGLAIGQDDTHRTLRLAADLGGDSAWLALVVRRDTLLTPAAGASDSMLFVASHGGHALTTHQHRLADGSWTLDVVEPDSNPDARDVFFWRVGVPVLVRATPAAGGPDTTAAALRVSQWQVWTPKERYDSSGRSSARKWLLDLSLAGALIAGVLASVKAMQEVDPKAPAAGPPTAFTADDCVRAMVDEIKETSAEQALVLEMSVLGSASCSEVMERLGAGPGAPRAKVTHATSVEFAARTNLHWRLGKFANRLDEVRQRLHVDIG